jgi:2'-5' RNA ligase
MDTESAVRAVVAFPKLEADDRQWIESIRAKHDPEAKNIAAHFTLVFPSVLPVRATEVHVARVAQSSEPIRFVLRRAAVVSDAIGSGGHVFLLPEDGRDALTGLHERLYEGALQPHLRRNVSFTPHITVAAATAIDPLHALAGELNAKGMSIRGSISEIVLVEVTPAEIRHAAQFELGAGWLSCR